MSSYSDNMLKPDGSDFDSIFSFYHLISLLSSPATSGHALPRQQRDPDTTPGRFTGKGTMIKSTTGKLVGFIGTVAVSAALVGFAATGTGAYFSDSRSGAVTGATGSIKVVTGGGSGTDGLDFRFTDMLPGEPQTATATYQNSGRNKQDVWLVFPNADALHALNNLGTFGQVHVSSNGTEIFASNNLNDDTRPGHCPTGTPGCTALPAQIPLASNVASGDGGSVSFSFAYGPKLKGNTVGPFNCYPLGDLSCPASGLPFKIVATQHGIAPDDANNTPGNVGH
jgi:hypothetical protein